MLLHLHSHVHSVMGAFGLNASILDAANLAWKLGLAAKGIAKTDVLLPTYNDERRQHAVRVIEVSGTYLRFVCGSDLHVPNLRDIELLNRGEPNGVNGKSHQKVAGMTNGQKPKEAQKAADLDFLADFFKTNGQFLLGVDCPYDPSVITQETSNSLGHRPPLRVKAGVRAPNPRVCFATGETGYLYDKLGGPARFHLVVFASSLTRIEVQHKLRVFAEALQDPAGFYRRFGGSRLFNIVLVAKLMPFQQQELPSSASELLDILRNEGAQIVFDDRAPDDDAHTTWGANHAKGGVAIIRPDLWVSMTAFPDETDVIAKYFEGFLQSPQE